MINMAIITRMELQYDGEYTRVVEREVEGDHVFYMASCPELPSILTHDYTPSKAFDMLDEAIAIDLEHAKAYKLPTPPPPRFDISKPGTYGAPHTILMEIDCKPPELSITRWQQFSNWFWMLRWRYCWRLA